MQMSIKLSDNFRLSELTKSNTALRLGIDNTPSQEEIDRLEYLCLRVLQPVRNYYNRSVIVSSGFRCLQLNQELKSGNRSQHVRGEAADFEIPGLDNYEVACWVRDNLEYDQLILEFYDGSPSSGWIHVSIKEEGNNRMECLTINKGNIKRGLVK
jgi:zinc D-Ala-D-Ala carboxypeptidase